MVIRFGALGSDFSKYPAYALKSMPMEQQLPEFVRRAKLARTTGTFPRQCHLLSEILQGWAHNIMASDNPEPAELQRLTSLCCGTRESTTVWLCTLNGPGAFHCPLGVSPAEAAASETQLQT